MKPIKPPMRKYRSVLIENCSDIEKAIHYAYDVAMDWLGEKVKIVFHVESPYGHLFIFERKDGGKGWRKPS